MRVDSFVSCGSYTVDNHIQSYSGLISCHPLMHWFKGKFAGFTPSIRVSFNGTITPNSSVIVIPRPYLSMLKMKYETVWWFQYVKIHPQKHARHLNQSSWHIPNSLLDWQVPSSHPALGWSNPAWPWHMFQFTHVGWMERDGKGWTWNFKPVKTRWLNQPCWDADRSSRA